MLCLPSTSVFSSSVPALTAPATTEEALRAVFGGLGENTLRAYRRSWGAFAEFLGLDPDESSRRFFALSEGQANLAAMRWVSDMRDKAYAPATIQSRLGALSGICMRMRRIGVIGWNLEVEGVHVQKLRDTAGPGTDAVRAMLATCADDTPQGTRNRAILSLLYVLALRRSEVVSMDLADVDLERNRIQIKGKGRDEPEWLSVPPKVADSLRAWLRHRGTAEGPLFLRLDSGHESGRLTANAIYLLVTGIGRKVGITVWPHALRHSGISAAAEAFNGNMLKVSVYARHHDMNTTKVYIDRLEGVQGEVASGVADCL